jgi:hypothetical protein
VAVDPPTQGLRAVAQLYQVQGAKQRGTDFVLNPSEWDPSPHGLALQLHFPLMTGIFFAIFEEQNIKSSQGPPVARTGCTFLRPASGVGLD